jgi:hypothetical protein
MGGNRESPEALVLRRPFVGRASRLLQDKGHLDQRRVEGLGKTCAVCLCCWASEAIPGSLGKAEVITDTSYIDAVLGCTLDTIRTYEVSIND